MTNTLQQISDEIADLVAAASDSVIRVDARRRLPATGLAWSQNLIVTANHVVEPDSPISIGRPDGDDIPAELIGRDPRIDLALLRVDASLQPITRAEAELRVGNLVLALGRPRRRIKASLGLVTGGPSPIAGRKRRKRMKAIMGKRMKGGMKEWRGRGWRKRIRWDAEGIGLALGGFIQSDLTMYPGFSGGPLLGADGAVYGMNTSGFAGGISIALPLPMIARSVTALLEHGKILSGYLGIGVQPAQLSASLAEQLGQDTGLLVVSVEAGSPASQAGLMVGDILTALDEEPLEDVDELQALLARLDLGSEVKTGYARGGQLSEGSIIIGEK